MNKEIVFFFKNGANRYLVYKENNEYIAAKYVGDEISTNLKTQEKSLINHVFNKM